MSEEQEKQKSPIEERRIKLLVVEPRMVVDFLFSLANEAAILIPESLALPVDVQVLGVSTDMLSDSILIKVVSGEFEPVPMGWEYEKIPVPFLGWVRRELVDPVDLQGLKRDLHSAHQEIATLQSQLEDADHRIGEG